MLIRAIDDSGLYVYFRTVMTSMGHGVPEWTHNPEVANCYADFQTANEILFYLDNCMVAGRMDMQQEMTVVDYKTMEEVQA